MKKCKTITVPLSDIPSEAFVTGYARLKDDDGHYTGKNVDENYEFLDRKLADVLTEMNMIERIRKNENVFVAELVVTDLRLFPRAL